MSLRKFGANCPNDAGGLMRRGVLALVVLLLACVLMAGAVSAEEKTASTWEELKTNLTGSNSVTLTTDIEAKLDELKVESGTPTLNLAGYRLYNNTPGLSYNGEKADTEKNARYQKTIINVSGGTLTITGNDGKIESSWTSIVVTKGQLDVKSGVLINKIPNETGKMVHGPSIQMLGDTTKTSEKYSVVTIASGATVQGYGWGIIMGVDKSKIYGMELDVSGTLTGNQTASNTFGIASGGLTVNGNLQPKNGMDITAKVPEVRIHDGATITGYNIASESTAVDYNGAAVYGAGFANWTIAGGTITGGEALGIKSGNWHISSGEFNGNGLFADPAETYGNGSEPTGAALSVTTNHGYAKNVSITITGGKFTSDRQSAFYEGSSCDSNTKKYQYGSALKKIAITGGSFETKNTTLSAITIQNSGDTTNITNGISIKDKAGNNLLYRGVNLTNSAEWTGDNTNGYTLKLTEENGKYKLMDDINYAVYTQANRITLEKIVTLDLNGKKITAPTNTEDGTSFIKISDAKSLTITDSSNGNGEISITNSKSTEISGTGKDGAYMFFIGNKGKLTIENGKYSMTGWGHLISGNGNGSCDEPEIIINGGTFTTPFTAIYMPAKDGKVTITNGTITANTGIEARAGKIEISGNTEILANGDNHTFAGNFASRPYADGSAIVLSSTNEYQGQVTLNITGNAKITSINAAAIRNYISEGEAKVGDPSVIVKIEDNAKLSGASVIDNVTHTGKTPVGTFNLFGGYYQAPSYDKLLVGKPTVTYQIGYAMSDTPVKDDYYAPIEVKIPEKPATPSADGKTVEPTSGSDVSHDSGSNVVNITSSSGATGAINVNLTLTYPEGTTINVDGTTKEITAGSAPEKVVAEYADVPLDATTGGSFQLSVEFSNVTNITKLPTISTVINPEAKEKLETESSMSLISMIVVDISQMKAAGETPKLTLTFIVPISSFTGKDLNSIEAYHYDGKNLISWPTKPTRTTQGDNYVFTLIGVTEASPWMIGAKATSPGPAPQPIPPVYSSGDGNMENSFRVLFDTIGGSFISPVTYLSYGDKISQPPAPTKDGYTFGGWYKDSACTQSWSFSEGIPGDMTLYAKWTPSSGGQSSSSQQTVSQTGSATAQQTVKATPAATQVQSTSAATPAASGTAASGSTSPAMTQAPAPVLGALLGLLAAGVLIRRRD